MSAIKDLAIMPVKAYGRSKAGNWSITDDRISETIVHRRLYHYNTMMLVVVLTGDLYGGRPDAAEVIGFQRGWGSVSDKQGVNKFLLAAGLRDTYKSLSAAWGVAVG